MSKRVNRSEPERKFMIVYTVLAMAFLIAGVSAAMAFPMFLGTIPEIIFCWGIYEFQKGDSASRAVIMTVSSLVTMAFFGVMVTFMDILVPLFAVLLVMIGMFNSRLLLGLWAADAALMFLYHLFVGKSYDLSSGDDCLRLFYQLFCLGVMLYLEEAMIRRNIERKRQMSEKVELLQESERSRDQFVSGVFRRFRNPLREVCGRGELILNSQVSGEVREAVEKILASGHSMQELVKDASDYMKIQGGRLVLEEEAYSFASLIRDITDAVNAQNADKRLEITLDCQGDIPCTMVGDSGKIHRIIMCLMSNAIKYTQKGSVVLRIFAQEEPFGVNLCISVRDTGVGMTRETVAGILSDFGRKDGEADSRYGGVGVSLVLMGRLVEMMKGSIDVTSEPGAGSEFRVIIPQKLVHRCINS